MDLTDSTLRKALEGWGVSAPRSVRTPETGTINTNLIIDADEGRFVLRRYNHQDRNRIEQEHALVLWAHDRGIPAVPPLRAKTGGSYLEQEGWVFALFPFAPGDQILRDALCEEDVTAMGRFLGRLHNTLSAYLVEKVGQRTFRVDRDETFRIIDRLERILLGKRELERTDEYALRRLRGRRSWLERNQNVDIQEIQNLKFQVIHGDYNETNLFFKNEEVVAIIDWSGYAAPRSWEILRTMHLVFDFKVEPCRMFLEAYRTEAPMGMLELDQCARCYSVSRGHSLWLFEAIYREGNDRLRRFLGPGEFVPIEKRWSQLRNGLSGPSYTASL